MSNNQEDTLRTEYTADTIRSGIRGKFANRYQQGTNVVLLDADVHQLFPDAKAVNLALRQYAIEHKIGH